MSAYVSEGWRGGSVRIQLDGLAHRRDGSLLVLRLVLQRAEGEVVLVARRIALDQLLHQIILGQSPLAVHRRQQADDSELSGLASIALFTYVIASSRCPCF